MKRALRYYPGCTTDAEWMRDFAESVRAYWLERFKEKNMTQWEYKRVHFNVGDFETAMNGYGKAGWECMRIDESQGLCYAYFKKPWVPTETAQLLNE